MDLRVVRRWCDDDCSIGELYVDGVFECFTLEDAERLEKIYGETAIPTGEYTLALTYSPRFQRTLPLVCEVPKFEGIRIHPGNTSADTEGCILVGQTRGANFVYRSRAAFDALMTKLWPAARNGEPISITIEDECA